MKRKRSSKVRFKEIFIEEYPPIFNNRNEDYDENEKINDNERDTIETETKPFFSGYSELSRLLIFIIFLSLAGYIFYVLVFERSIQGKIMRFVASVVPED